MKYKIYNINVIKNVIIIWKFFGGWCLIMSMSYEKKNQFFLQINAYDVSYKACYNWIILKYILS